MHISACNLAKEVLIQIRSRKRNTILLRLAGKRISASSEENLLYHMQLEMLLLHENYSGSWFQHSSNDGESYVFLNKTEHKRKFYGVYQYKAEAAVIGYRYFKMP